MTLFYILLFFAYLLGSIPFGKIVAHHYGINIQKKGSGNIGFANCLRILGWKPALFVLMGDILKGFIPVIIASNILSRNETLLIGFVAIVGHIFPVWLGFRGGKGIATGLGITLAINPLIGIIGIIVFLITLSLSKIMSVSSVLSAWGLSVIAYFISQNLILFYVCLAILATWTHRDNIKRLMEGAEKKVTE